MKKLAFFTLLPTLLFCEISTSSISSESASYDGNALVLRGSVRLGHTLGEMRSEVARLVREDSNGPFSAIHLCNAVEILLKNHGKISCSTANFDFASLSGNLIAKTGEMIEFTDLSNQVLTLSSRQAEIEFIREFDELKIGKVSTNVGVDVLYGTDFSLHAEKAIYIGQNPPMIEVTENCILNHFEDCIFAEKIQLYPESATVVLEIPKGHLKPTAFSQSSGVDFSCDKLLWENMPQTLTLQGNVNIHDDAIGTIRSDEEIELKQKQQDGKWVVSNIRAKGKTTFEYDHKSPSSHLLISHGGMELDGDRLVLTMQSPQGNPIEYHHEMMLLTADQAQLDYLQKNHSITPSRLLLTGNIRLYPDPKNMRCAIADQFIYLPEEKKLILSSKDEGNVLFWDKERGLSISAKEVHILQTDHGENIKGVGNVRFAFSSTENALLKKLFPFYQSKEDAHE